MELEKQPRTQLEIYAVIEQLGGFIWRMNHDLADRRIEDPNGAIQKDIDDARRISAQLVEELGKKFGVLPPPATQEIADYQRKHKAPVGKIYYWDWYKLMKVKCYEVVYRRIICSSCPFTTSVADYAKDERYPCKYVEQHSLLRVMELHVCGMVARNRYAPHDKGWTEEQWYEAIRQEYGRTWVNQVKAKQRRLTRVAEAAAAAEQG